MTLTLLCVPKAHLGNQASQASPLLCCGTSTGSNR